MNEELIRELDKCIALCDRAIQMSKEDIEKYREFLGGEILEVYKNASKTACEKLKVIRKKLKELKTAEINRP